MSMEIRKNRVKELRMINSSDLRVNPNNWRRHPENQKQGMKALLDNIGYAGVLLAYEKDDELVLIDGHLRQEVTPDEEVPVVILDVNEQEANTILATYDPISMLADYDSGSLNSLINSLDNAGDDLTVLIEDISERWGLEELLQVDNETESYFVDNPFENYSSISDDLPEGSETLKAFLVHLPVSVHDEIMETVFELGDLWEMETVAEVFIEGFRRLKNELK